MLQAMDGRPLMLGDMCKPWGRLVKYWDGSGDSRPIVRWAESNLPHSHRLREPRLNTLNEVRKLRNQAVHFGTEPPGLDAVEKMLELLLNGPTAILTRLHEAAGMVPVRGAEPTNWENASDGPAARRSC